MGASPQALIFNVQRFSVHDGPGIRTTVFFKGCPLRCRWCQNPESLSPRPELAVYDDRCRHTGHCATACRQGALRLDGHLRLDRERCDACGQCVSACPYDALAVIGRTVTLDELLGEVMRDEPFYRASGGGVTLSGGEATTQLPFAAALAERCGAAGVGVGLQTCGLFRWSAFEPHLPLFAFIHYDLKVMDREAHRRLTGGDNRAVLDNARRLVTAGAPVTFRMPIVPDHTDGESNLRAVARFVGELGVESLHLLRYHAMGEVKSGRLGDPLPVLDVDPRRAEASLRSARDLLRSLGMAVTCDLRDGLAEGSDEAT